ncbi:SRPBCC family protein [Streptomyces roseirectus]|uniref:SRPBCC family protein n=1 Tax=Streptomyces roseirectus TaxID=2768066 RepID=A0A7H0IRP7_9ACTN|nr:SRPBCC family protein [Streptomyces roseirectus]QNP75463.1 SRPBCC family protein [Streptomyces roseirectus]
MHDTPDSRTDIHWPSGFSPADAHSHHRTRAVVPGSPERTFALLTDVAAWPTWIPACEEVSTDAFTETFEVRWAGYRFEIFVGEHAPPRRLGWLGVGAGVQIYQAWLFTEVEGGTEVVVENAVRAALPKAVDTLSRAWGRRVDDLWRARLARLSKGLPGPPPSTRVSAGRRHCAGIRNSWTRWSKKCSLRSQPNHRRSRSTGSRCPAAGSKPGATAPASPAPSCVAERTPDTYAGRRRRP